MKCECGSERFSAHQQCYHDVIVDENGNFEKDDGIYQSNNPYGPFTCIECDREYEELTEPVIDFGKRRKNLLKAQKSIKDDFPAK